MEKQLTVGSKVLHPKYGEGVIMPSGLSTYRVYFRNHGEKEISKDFTDFEILELADENSSSSPSITLADIEFSLTSVLTKLADFTVIVPLADKWIGGTMLLQPQDQSLQPKEIPIETFFHKIVMVRDRLRVMEQQINANSKMNDEEKVNLQQYITRIYGSLTTFNVLFKHKENYFTGDSKEK